MKSRDVGWVELRKYDDLKVEALVRVRWTPPIYWKEGTVIQKTTEEVLIEMADGSGGLYLPKTGITKCLHVWVEPDAEPTTTTGTRSYI